MILNMITSIISIHAMGNKITTITIISFRDQPINIHGEIIDAYCKYYPEYIKYKDQEKKPKFCMYYIMDTLELLKNSPTLLNDNKLLSLLKKLYKFKDNKLFFLLKKGLESHSSKFSDYTRYALNQTNKILTLLENMISQLENVSSIFHFLKCMYNTNFKEKINNVDPKDLSSNKLEDIHIQCLNEIKNNELKNKHYKVLILFTLYNFYSELKLRLECKESGSAKQNSIKDLFNNYCFNFYGLFNNHLVESFYNDNLSNCISIYNNGSINIQKLKLKVNYNLFKAIMLKFLDDNQKNTSKIIITKLKLVIDKVDISIIRFYNIENIEHEDPERVEEYQRENQDNERFIKLLKDHDNKLKNALDFYQYNKLQDIINSFEIKKRQQVQ